MRTVIPAVRGGNRPRGPDPADPAEQLRDLARQLARLNVTGRLDPEAIVSAKHSIVRGLHRIAAEIEP